MSANHRHMKWICLAVVAVLLGIWTTSACMAAKVELVLWDNTVSRLNLTKEYAEKYMQENPTVHITLNAMPSIDQKLAVALAAGTPPDLAQLHNAWAPRYVDSLQPYPKDMFPRADLRKRYIAFDATSTVNGEVYFLPLGIMNGAVYYNVNQMNQAGIGTPPQDWPSFIRTARRLTRMRSDGTMESAGFSFLGNFMWIWSDIIYQYGGFLFGEKGGVTFTSGPSHSAFNTMLELLNANIDASGTDFAKGTSAMRYSWTHYENTAQKMGFDYGVSMLPTPTGSSLPARGRSNVEIGLGVPKGISGVKQEEAFKFIKWLYNNDDFVVQLSNLLGAVPSRQDVWNNPVVTANKSMMMLMRQAAYTVFPGPVDNWYWDLLNEACKRLMNGEGLSAVLEDVQRRGDAIYKENPVLSVERMYAPPGR